MDTCYDVVDVRLCSKHNSNYLEMERVILMIHIGSRVTFSTRSVSEIFLYSNCISSGVVMVI